MRIAIFHNLPSGGGKRALYEIARRLVDRHELHVYTFSCAEHQFGDIRPFCRQYHVFPFTPVPVFFSPFGRLNQISHTLTLFQSRLLQRKIARQIDCNEYDLVYVQNCQFEQSPSVLSFLRTPSVFFSGEPPRKLYEPDLPRPYTRLSSSQRILNRIDPLPYLYRTVWSALDRKNIKAANLVLVNSIFSRENLYRVYGISARLCYLGVDSQVFQPLGLPKENFVLSVGAVRPNKGYDFLIYSLSMINPTYRPGLVIVCNAANHEEVIFLEDYARTLGVSLQFREMISDSELARLYNAALLTLYAPVMEPFGLAPIESMACSTPVIAVREGGIRETVIHEKTGLLTERDPASFSAAVDNLLRDPDLCRQYGENGRWYVEKNWGWDSCLLNLDKLFLQVIEHDDKICSGRMENVTAGTQKEPFIPWY